MSLIDELAAENNPNEPEYNPRTEYDGTHGYIQTAPMTVVPVHDEILKEFGYDPDEVMIVGNPHVSRWQQRSRDRDTGEFETHWLQAYKFSIVPKLNGSLPDIEAMVLRAKGKVSKPVTAPDPYWFVFQAGDQQIGKKSKPNEDRQATLDDVVERYLLSVEQAREQFKTLKRHGIEGIQLSFPGDCIEGNQSQGGRNNGWMTELAITEQVKVFRRLLYHTIERLAPLAAECVVTVVNGNHDDADRQLNMWPGAGWATHCAEAVFERLEDNPNAFSHCKLVIPNAWRGAVATTIGDTVVGVVHGHQWRANGAMNWLSQQAVNRHPVGGAQVVQYGHWHQMQMNSNRHVTLMGSPTFEVASDYLIDKRGSTAKRGALVYLMRAGDVSYISLV